MRSQQETGEEERSSRMKDESLGLNESSGCGNADENQGYSEGDPALRCSASGLNPWESRDVCRAAVRGGRERER